MTGGNIVVEYIASGPTIALKVSSVQDVRRLKSLFMELGLGRVREVALSEPGHFRLVGLSELILKVAERPESFELGASLEEAGGPERAGQRYIWQKSMMGWRCCAGLAEPFEDGEPGFQYLIEETRKESVELPFKVEAS